MSKNLTRKGLAFGALVALGASAFAGTPAFAADTVVLAPNYSSDTTLATAVTGTFSLNASLAPGSVSANISQLKYKIVNNGAAQVNYSIANASTTVTGNVTAVEGSEYATPTSATALVANTIDLSINSASATTTTQTATVTAFIDANLDGLLQTGEAQQSQTVSFIKHSEITTATTIAAATAGDTAVTATVKFTNINNQSLTAANVGAYFTKGDGTGLLATADDSATVTGVATGSPAAGSNRYTANNNFAVGDVVTVASTDFDGTFTVTAATSTTFDVTSADTTGSDVAGTVTRSGRAAVLKSGVAYSATNAGFKFTTGTVVALAKGSAVKVQPLLKTSALVSTDSASTIGSAQTASVTTRTVSALTANFVKSTTAAAANAASTAEAEAVSLNAAKSVEFKVLDAASTPAAFAGQVVSVAVTTSATLSSTKTITINGTTYSAGSALPGATGVAKLSATTGADGKAVVTYTTAGFANNDTVTLTATIENFSATAVGTETTRSYSQYIENHEGATAVTTDGTAVKVDVIVLDQFGGAPADGTYQITATWVSSSQATANATAASGTFAAVVGGKATLSILDNGTGLGTNVYTIARYDVAANGVLTNAVTTGLNTFTINIVAATDVAAGKVTLTSGASGAELTKNSAGTAYVLDSTASTLGYDSAHTAALTYSAGSSVDLRRIAGTAASTLAADGTTSTATTGLVTVYGTVYSASTSTYAGVPVAGQVVTITGTNKQFAATQDSAVIYGANTLSVVSDNNGKFAFSVWSNLAGKQLVTITSGAGTSVVETYFAAAAVAATATVTTTVGDGAAQFQAGRALDVTVKVADKFGNPIATTGASTADDGHLVISQTGAGYLSVSGNGGTTVATNSSGVFTTKLITNSGDLGTSTIVATVDLATDVTKSVSSEFGVTDADVTVGGRAVYASVEFAKGKTVTVSVDGKRLYSKLFSTDAYTELKFTQKTAGKHTVTVRISGGIVYSEVVTTTK